MKKSTLLRAVAVLTAFIISAASLVSCSFYDKGEYSSANVTDLNAHKRVKTAPEGVFRASYPEIDLGSNTWLQYAVSGGDEVYLVASYYKEVFVAEKDTDSEITQEAERVTEETEKVEDSGEYRYENGIRLIKIDSDGDVSAMRDFANTYTHDAETEISTFINYSAAHPLSDGSIWALAQIGSDDRSTSDIPVYKSENRLIKYDAKGEELLSVNISDALSALCDNGVSASDISVDRFFFNPDGSILLCGDRIVAVITESGELVAGSGVAGNVRLGNFVQLKDGETVGISYTYDSEKMQDIRKLVTIDTATSEISEIGDMPFADAHNIYPCYEKGKVFVSNRSALYLYDLSTGELTEYVNWLNSDLNSNRITVLTGLSGGRVVVSENTRDYTEMRLAILLPDKKAEKKYTFTLGSLYLDDGMTEAMISFNKQSPGTRILYSDYSVYNTVDNPDKGTEMLLCDIGTENTPDIVSLSGLSLFDLLSENCLFDLSEYVSADLEFNADDYYENVLYHSQNKDSIYSIIPVFTVETVTGKTAIFGDEELTVKRLLEIASEHPGASLFGKVTRGELLDAFIRLALQDFVDLENGTTSFENEDFLSILKLIKSYPSEIDWDSFYEGMTEEEYKREELSYFENRTLLSCSYLSKFAFTERERKFGDEISYVGFPTHIGASSAIKAQTELALCKNSKNAPLAWEFLKYLISGDGASLLSGGFSVNKAVTEKMAENAVAENTSVQNGNSENADNTLPLADRAFTRKDADKMLDLIGKANSVIREDTDIERIIREETEKFFNSQTSAEETAKNIDEKIVLLMNS